MLISRGDCSFTTKALHAQAVNASLVIIYNNSPGDFLTSFALLLSLCHALALCFRSNVARYAAHASAAHVSPARDQGHRYLILKCQNKRFRELCSRCLLWCVAAAVVYLFH